MIRTTLATAALALLAGPAFAVDAQDCAGTENLRQRLTDFGESIISIGTSEPNGTMFEVWGSSEFGTWTFVETDPEYGISCIVQYGDAFAINAAIGEPA